MTGAVIPPLSLSTTFKQLSPGEPMAGMDYSRSGNPTRHHFEEAVAALEGGKHGMSPPCFLVDGGRIKLEIEQDLNQNE